MNASFFVQGISKLEKRIPQNGNVSLVFQLMLGKSKKWKFHKLKKSVQ